MEKWELTEEELAKLAGELWSSCECKVCEEDHARFRLIATAAGGKARQWVTNQQTITCPFCGEGDFDQAGLVHHLDNFCEEYTCAKREWVECRTGSRRGGCDGESV